MTKKSKINSSKNVSISIEDKLRALYDLQTIDSEVDKIRIVRGELPLEIQDLKDSIEGLKVRLEKLENEFRSIEDYKLERKNIIKDSKSLVVKYKKQLDNIKNNREFVSLTKEIEFHTLEVELSEKRIKESEAKLLHKQEVINSNKSNIEEKEAELKIKEDELGEIVKETEKDEKVLLKKSKKAESIIDERLLNSYKKIRKKVVNGLAVVSVERSACGGCFNQIPPQRQLDIQLHKKIISCEHCGRVLIDSNLFK